MEWKKLAQYGGASLGGRASNFEDQQKDIFAAEFEFFSSQKWLYNNDL